MEIPTSGIRCAPLPSDLASCAGPQPPSLLAVRRSKIEAFHGLVQAHIYIHNLVIGNLYLDHRGHITVVQRATGDIAKLSLSENLLNNLSHRYTHQVRRC